MAQKDVENKIPIYKLKTTDEVMKYYDEWGKENKYDKDMEDWNYTGPKETSKIFNKYSSNKEFKNFPNYLEFVDFITPNKHEAEFILARAKKNESYESNTKYISKVTFSIKKTDNPVTSGIVGKYLSSDLYLSYNQSKMEV